jgi:hypothetical protein
MHVRSVRCELQCNCAPDAAAAASNDRGLAMQTEIFRIFLIVCQNENSNIFVSFIFVSLATEYLCD